MNKKIKNFRKTNASICYYCKKHIPRENFVTVDHKESLAKGGKDVRENYAISCAVCNGEKGAMNEKEYKRFLAYKAYLSTLTDEKIKSKEEILLAVLKKKTNTVFFKRSVARKMKALKAVKKKRQAFDEKKEIKLKKIINRLESISHLVEKEKNSFKENNLNNIKKKLENKVFTKNTELLPHFLQLEELALSFLNQEKIDDKIKNEIKKIHAACAFVVAEIKLNS